MSKPLVVVTKSIPEVGIEALKAHFDVKIGGGIKGASAVLSQLSDKIDGRFLDQAGRQLKIAANYAVGFDNIDLAAAKKRKIVVTNTPGVLTEAVAEHSFALLMAVARRIVESDGFLRGGKYKGWEAELLLGPQIEGKTLGILGLGRIGSRVAEIGAKGYKMKVIYYDRGQRNRDLEKEIGAEPVSMRKILTASDFISLHVPLTRETRHMIGRQELASMKSTAILINTSRGPVVDEKALAQALRKKIIWGAGIDVFEFEPRVSAELKKLDNVIMTPHTASATREARDAMAVLAAKNIIAVLQGKKPLTPVK